MRDTNVTIDYRTKLRIHEILPSQSITGKTENVRDTNVTIDNKRKLRMCEVIT